MKKMNETETNLNYLLRTGWRVELFVNSEGSITAKAEHKDSRATAAVGNHSGEAIAAVEEAVYALDS